MQPTDDALSDSPAEDGSPHAGELVVQDGRLSGSRWSLAVPLTLIGQAESCDVRLQDDAIHPCHCVLALDAAGLHLRDLPGDGSTLVNGAPVSQCLLHDGDLVSVGPFTFRVYLPAQRALSNQGDEREKQALRIQAAAVAAQQAALLEDEIRLEQRRSALQQQEQQLAAHLEEKRERLVALREEASAARTALLQERSNFEQRVELIMRSLAQSRRETADQQRLLQTQRRVLSGFRQRLKRRWHRHWATERAAMSRRAEELHQLERQLQRDAERLHQERTRLDRTRLRANGEFELTRRQQQEEWDQLQKARSTLQEQSRALDQRESTLLEAASLVAEETRTWNDGRLRLYNEVEGLESRVRNYRRKILDQEQELLALKLALNQGDGSFSRPPQGSAEQTGGCLPSDDALPRKERLTERSPGRETDYETQLAALEKLSAELADQRLCLAEECERLAQAQQRWYQERTAALRALEDLGLQFQGREQLLRAREQALERAEYAARQQADEVAETHKVVEALKARASAGVSAWETERTGLLADLQAREQVVNRTMAAVTALRERWERRRRRQVLRLRRQRQTYEELRRESAVLRAEWLQRSTVLVQEQRRVAERGLALEQYRQECISKAANPKAAEKRLEHLRRRWAALSVSARRALALERRKFKAESQRLEERARQLEQHAHEVTSQAADLSNRQATWEEKQLTTETDQERLHQELQVLRIQRRQLEQQLQVLREQVEHLARLLIDDHGGPAPLPTAQAA
jgi:pSer/pThr/pTyr-binding forkhead associated (FHA) protein